jgi:hypothetical protein
MTLTGGRLWVSVPASGAGFADPAKALAPEAGPMLIRSVPLQPGVRAARAGQAGHHSTKSPATREMWPFSAIWKSEVPSPLTSPAMVVWVASAKAKRSSPA